MKVKFIPLAVLFVMGIILFTSLRKFPAKKIEKVFHVKGTIMLVSAHCGGVAPTPQMELNERKPHAQPLTTIYFREGNSNYDSKHIVDSVTSDSTGKFSIDLPAGTYCVIEKYKTNKFKYPEADKNVDWDTACYRKSFERCDFVLDVTKDVDSVNIVFAHNCIWRNPCVKNYHGPRPGSLAPGKGLPSGQEMPKPKQ